MKNNTLVSYIIFLFVFIGIVLISSTTLYADTNGTKYSPLSEQNRSFLTRDENTTTFLDAEGRIEKGYRCGTVHHSQDEADRVQKALDEFTNKRLSLAIPCTVTIPVAFHILRHNDGIAGDVTDQQISDQIDVLNNSYASTSFQFELQSIERINNDTWSQMNTYAAELAAKQALAIDPATTLNIYTCTDCQGYLGWSYFPDFFPEDSFLHGVVAKYSSFPGGSSVSYNEGDTVVHEVGHYLGLSHTFYNGCNSPGDYCDDTPYEATPAFGCPGGRDTCTQPGEDPIYNFMDYTDENCMNQFTLNQSERMDSMVELYKPSLINCGNTAMPSVLWDDVGNIYVSVVDLEVIFGNEWDIMVTSIADLSGEFGFAMRFYNPQWNEFGITILADDNWNARGHYGVWQGHGTPAATAIADGIVVGTVTFFTSAPSFSFLKKDGVLDIKRR